MMERFRRWSQIVFAILGNSYWLFPWRTPIYQGPAKGVCFPGLNCYSCPAATMACPLGALQNSLASLRPSLQVGELHFGSYVLGTLGMVGSLVGRLPCGWLCPFGLIQDWFFRIPGPKYRLWRPLRRLPYVFLVAFVILLPLFLVDSLGYGTTWFCKFVCPAGTLEAGLPLLWLEAGVRRTVGWLFVHKVLMMVIVLVWSMVTIRPFCRSICPLGAIYGLFNRASLLRLRFHPDRCVECGACRILCPASLSFFDGMDDLNSGACIRCLRCYSECPVHAISLEFGLQAREQTETEAPAKPSQAA